MEKLSEYLQTLLSTCSYELHLEPNKTPFMIHASGTTEVANTPLLGTQISTIVFPLIPNEVKQQLPNQSEVEFVHNHNLGNFSFHVKKSPAGFNVTIRPLFGDDAPGSNDASKTESISAEPEIQTAAEDFAPSDVSAYTNGSEAPAPGEGKSALNFETAAEYKYDPAPADETVSDSEFQDSLSGNSSFNTPFTPHQYSAEDESLAADMNDFATQSVNMSPVEYIETRMESNSSTDDFAASSFTVSDQFGSQMKTRIDALFMRMAEAGASDLHLSVSVPPMIRKDGKMMQLESDESVLTPSVMKELLSSIMPTKNRQEFEQRHDTDFAYEIPGLARFRANVFADRKGMGGVFRIIPTEILTAEQLGLSKAIMDLCDLSKGLVVVTGPTGSGKSTTLCAMVDSINKSREDHIITIEDPIEFTHENQKCLVNQREVHNHTDSFKNALRAALREDPDILLVGEMRDLETISIAIETAETGHLVFGTLHTTTAASTVDRIIDQFPADRQQQVRVMLSESLRGVIAQTLLPKKGGGRIAALEVLIVTPAISNLIREGKTFQIPSSMQTGKNVGMVMLNDALMDLVKKGFVEPRDAYIKAVDKPGFESLLKREGLKI